MAWAIFSMLFLAIGGVVYGAAALIWFALTILANWPSAKSDRSALDHTAVRVIILIAVQVCRIQKIEHFPDFIFRHVIKPQKRAVKMDIAGNGNHGIYHKIKSSL